MHATRCALIAGESRTVRSVGPKDFERFAIIGSDGRAGSPHLALLATLEPFQLKAGGFGRRHAALTVGVPA